MAKATFIEVDTAHGWHVVSVDQALETNSERVVASSANRRREFIGKRRTAWPLTLST